MNRMEIALEKLVQMSVTEAIDTVANRVCFANAGKRQYFIESVDSEVKFPDTLLPSFPAPLTRPARPECKVKIVLKDTILCSSTIIIILEDK